MLIPTTRHRQARTSNLDLSRLLAHIFVFVRWQSRWQISTYVQPRYGPKGQAGSRLWITTAQPLSPTWHDAVRATPSTAQRGGIQALDRGPPSSPRTQLGRDPGSGYDRPAQQDGIQALDRGPPCTLRPERTSCTMLHRRSRARAARRRSATRTGSPRRKGVPRCAQAGPSGQRRSRRT